MLFIVLFFSLDGDNDDRGGSDGKSSIELFNANELVIPIPRLTNIMLFKHDNIAPTIGNVLNSCSAIIIGNVLMFGVSGNTKHRTQHD